MSAHKDQYDFSRPSISGKAGFEPITDAGSGLHFFHFNDENGQPLLFSQAYQSAEKRDNGIDSVEKNRIIPGRVNAVEEAGGFSIVVRSGNHQEIARSRTCPNEELSVSVRKAVTRPEMGQKTAKTAEKPSPVPPVATQLVAEKPAEKPAETTTATAATPTETIQLLAEAEAPVGIKSDPSARQVFKVSFYQTGENERMQGKIEHLFSNEKAAFTGLDADAIGAFMKKMVPSLDLPMDSSGAKTEPAAVAEPTAPKPEQPFLTQKIAEKMIEKAVPNPVDAPVFAVSNAGKISPSQPVKRMRVLAVAKFEFTGATTDPTDQPTDTTDNAAQFTASPNPSAPDFLGMKNAVRPSVSAGQIVVSTPFRPAATEAEPSVSRKTAVIVAPAKITEPPTVFSTRPNLAIVSPKLDFRPMATDFAPSKMMERIIEKANSGKATVSNAPQMTATKTATPPPANPNRLVIGDKPAAPTTGKTTLFIGEKSPKTALPGPVSPPAIRRVLDPGQTPPGFDRSKVVKRSVHYVG